MAVITLSDDQGTSFTTPAAFDDATMFAEFAATDDNSTPTATAAFWIKLSINSVDHIVYVPADTVYEMEFRRGDADQWTWAVAAASGTADITCLER